MRGVGFAFVWSACASSAFTQAQEQDAYAPFVAEASREAEAAITSFRVPAGWTVELVAAEPELANPVCFAFDHDGRTIFVGETFRHHRGVTDIRDHMDWNDDDLAARTVEDRVAYFKKHLGDKFPDYERACERVRRLTDVDGDGRFETATVFSDRFRDAAAGIGASLLSYRGDVFYTCIPSLWRLRDEDGDGRAEIEDELSTGYGVHVALLGHDLHGLRIGPDGKLYFSIGDRGFNVPLADGTRIEYPQSGAVLRSNLDGSDLEVFAFGLRNPQDLVFDAHGNLFTGDNNSDGGDRARLVQVVEGADSGWRQAYQWIQEPDVRGPWNDEKHWHPFPDNQAACILPPIANFADGPSGLTIDPGTGFPSRYAGWLFLADFRGGAKHSGVRGFELRPKGAGFALGDSEETWWGVLATDVEVGMDGALYVLDWTEGWNQTGKGRIYRAFDPTARAQANVREARKLLAEGFDQQSDVDLVRALGHADQRVRQEAQFALARRGASAQRTLEQVASASSERLPRLHAIWGLGMMLRRPRAQGVEHLYELLSDRDGEVRAQSARVLGDLRAAGATSLLTQRLTDPEPRVRLYAALGLARIGAHGRTPALVELARSDAATDPVLRHASSFALSRCATPAELADLARDASASVRSAAVVALRRTGHVRVQEFLADAEPAVALEAARAIYDEPIRDGFEHLAAALNQRGDEYAFQRRALNANFRLGTAVHAARLARFAQRAEISPKLRREALLRLGQWAQPSSRDTVVGAWRPLGERDGSIAVEHLVRLGAAPALRETPDLIEPWTAACVALRATGAVASMDALCAELDLPGDARAAVLRARVELDAEGSAELLAAALSDRDARVRAAALEELPRGAAERALSLAQRVLNEAELGERRAALRALAQIPGDGAASVLEAALTRHAAGLFAPELALDLVLAAESRQETALAAALTRHRELRGAEPKLAPYVDALHGGDASKGERLFRAKAELSCLRCHRIGNADAGGGEVGPDLRGLASRMGRLQILESICDPNRTIADGFRSTLVFLKDDTHVEGRVLSEDARTLVLIDANAQKHEIEVSQIEERREGRSSMPEDLSNHLSREEMRDLIEFLATKESR